MMRTSGLDSSMDQHKGPSKTFSLDASSACGPYADSWLCMSDSESEVGSPHSPSSPPSLLDATMDLVAAGAQHGLPLPHPTATLIAELFPSVDTATATVRSADGLGYACATLLRRGGGGGGPPDSPRLAEPLSGGGMLSFQLAAQPSGHELALMHAFAAELSARLHPSASCDGRKAAPAAPLAGPAPGAAGMHDAFFVSW